MRICKGDRAVFNSDVGTLHGVVTCKRYGFISVFSPDVLLEIANDE